MSDQITLQAESRTLVGTGASHKIRRGGRIPAVLYGHGTSQAISLDLLAFRALVRPDHYGSMMVDLVLDGKPAGKALVKGVQVNTMARTIMSVDLQQVSAADLVVVSVPIVLTGESPALRMGGVQEQFAHSVTVRTRADAVPEQITYDLSELGMDEAVHAAQLALPDGCELMDKPDETIVKIAPPTTHEATAETAEAATPEA